MRILYCVLFIFLRCAELMGQTWDINASAGTTFTRLIPVNGASGSTTHMRYGFFGPDLYLSPDVSIHINDHSRFSFAYQYAAATTGVKFRISGGSRDMEYERVNLHSFLVGYSAQRPILYENATLGWFAKAGLAFGHNVGSGSGAEGSSIGGGMYTSYVSIEKAPDSTAMPNFWMPVATLGITLGPSPLRSGPMGRLTFSLGATLGLRDIYAKHPQVHYIIADGQSVDEGTVKYGGLPLTIQVGVTYRLFRFGNLEY